MLKKKIERMLAFIKSAENDSNTPLEVDLTLFDESRTQRQLDTHMRMR